MPTDQNPRFRVALVDFHNLSAHFNSPRHRFAALGMVRFFRLERHFGDDVDPSQFAHDLYSVMLGFHHASRLLRDPRAEKLAHAAFERLLSSARRRRATA